MVINGSTRYKNFNLCTDDQVKFSDYFIHRYEKVASAALEASHLPADAALFCFWINFGILALTLAVTIICNCKCCSRIN